jgi:hypothetical protein
MRCSVPPWLANALTGRPDKVTASIGRTILASLRAHITPIASGPSGIVTQAYGGGPAFCAGTCCPTISSRPLRVASLSGFPWDPGRNPKHHGAGSISQPGLQPTGQHRCPQIDCRPGCSNTALGDRRHQRPGALLGGEADHRLGNGSPGASSQQVNQSRKAAMKPLRSVPLRSITRAVLVGRIKLRPEPGSRVTLNPTHTRGGHAGFRSARQRQISRKAED